MFLTAPAFAQKLVDPSTVALAYRQAAEIRRAEQIKQRECMHKADLEKVMASHVAAAKAVCAAVSVRQKAGDTCPERALKTHRSACKLLDLWPFSIRMREKIVLDAFA